MLQTLESSLGGESDIVRCNGHVHYGAEVGCGSFGFLDGGKNQGSIVKRHGSHIVWRVRPFDGHCERVNGALEVFLLRQRHSQLVERKHVVAGGKGPEPAAEKIHSRIGQAIARTLPFSARQTFANRWE